MRAAPMGWPPAGPQRGCAGEEFPIGQRGLRLEAEVLLCLNSILLREGTAKFSRSDSHKPMLCLGINL